jgi:hypothetical protein
MPNQSEATDLRAPFSKIAVDARRYFEKTEAELASVAREKLLWGEIQRDYFWGQLSAPLREEAAGLVNRLVTLAGDIAIVVRSAPLVAEADQRDVMIGTKAMRAALLLRRFRSWDTEVIHDEGTVLGVSPPGQSEDQPYPPEDAHRIYNYWCERILSILDLVAASRGLASAGVFVSGASESTRYRPNTAFIMMWMDSSRPELVDVSDTVKEVFSEFDINAVRADDIEHEGLITQRILDEIASAEFLFADLTGERPSVYYEVGYAHALGRRVILYRKAGTGLHFDLSGYNCPEYENLHALREKLSQRLQQLTNKLPRGTGSATPWRL